MKIKELEIGQILYSYNDKVLEHKVIEIQTLKTKEHIEKFWILECQTCADHSKCVFATKLDDTGNFIYSHMINQYEEDEWEESSRNRNSQYYWHEGAIFFLTKTESRTYVWNKSILYYEQNIRKSEESIEYNKKCIEETKERLRSLQDQKEEI